MKGILSVSCKSLAMKINLHYYFSTLVTEIKSLIGKERNGDVLKPVDVCLCDPYI